MTPASPIQVLREDCPVSQVLPELLVPFLACLVLLAVCLLSQVLQRLLAACLLCPVLLQQFLASNSEL